MATMKTIVIVAIRILLLVLYLFSWIFKLEIKKYNEIHANIT